MPKKICVTVKAPSWSNETRSKWLEFKSWIKSVGGQWTDGMGMVNISFAPVHEEELPDDSRNFSDGVEREVTALAGQVFKVDTSVDACEKFGFRPDQRVVATNGTKGSVVGVAPLPEESGCVTEGEDILWIAPDGRDGRVCFFPDPTNNLSPE